MFSDQSRDIEPWDSAVDDAPYAGDHNAVGAVRAAMDERGDRIVIAGKPHFIEREQCEVRLFADCDLADIVATET